MKEIWKPVPNTIFYASNLGRIKTTDRVCKFFSRRCNRIVEIKRTGVIRAQTLNRDRNYWAVSTLLNGKTKTYSVHRLIATAFIPNPLNKKQVNHIDGNRLNNRLENLEWATCSENMLHSFAIGINKSKRKTSKGVAIKIAEDLKNKVKWTDIEAKYGVNLATISRIKNNQHDYF